MQKQYITASELAEYIYCECCWIDRLEGLGALTPAMDRGTKEHNTIYSRYRLFILLKRLSIFIIVISIILLLVAFYFSLFLDMRLW